MCIRDRDIGDIVVFVEDKQVIKGNFKPTGKTVGEPLQDWHIKNFKSHRIGEVEFKNPGIYDISIHLRSRKKNIISWNLTSNVNGSNFVIKKISQH